MTTDATVSLEYDHLEYHAPFLMFSLNAPFSQGGMLVAVVHKSLTVTRTPKVTFRDEDGNRLLRIAAGQDINLRELRTGELQTPVVVNVYGPDGEPLIDPMQFKHNFDLRFRNARRIEIPTTPSPTPPPTKPPVLDTWKVTHPDGMNIRSTPQVTSTNLVGSVPTGWTFENDGSGATSTNYEWLHIYSGEHNGKNFAGNWIAVEKRSTGYRFCKLDLGLEPPATGTVQTTGALRLETGADGWTHVKGGDGSGFNMRYMATGRYNPDKYLDFIAGHGLKWVRVYFSQEKHTLQQCIDKFRVVLDKAAARGLLICGVVTDSLGHSGMIIEEDSFWHTGGGIGHLNIDWIMSKQYEKDYFRYVEGFAEAFKDHPGLGMIELVNEAGIYGVSPIELHHSQAYTEWMAESARLAYTACDGKKLIAFGGINTLHSRPPMKPLADHARDLIKACTHVQVWGIHFYSEKDYHPEALYRFEQDCIDYDYRFAKEFGKAIFGTEIGSWFTNQNRPLATEQVMKRNRGKWCGAFYWGLALDEDNGEADAHAMALYRDGQGEFDGMMAALAA